MSGIAGICNVDGGPVDRALLAQMTRAIAHRGPDGIGHWMAGPVALGHAMFHTTPESLRETQPLSMESAQQGSLCLTLDGRVDNRRELRAALESKGCALRTDTDAELVLRAYEHWDEDCARHIVGDFAFAIWDGRNRKLFCARDLLGIRPFYYHFDGHTFTFSSELRPLLDVPGFQRRLNAGMLGEYLCDRITCRDETLYQNILRLPPAHRLALKDGVLRVSRHFDFDPGKSIRYGSDEQYAEHFFEIFREAVSCRLRSQTPVALWLSGGLDSCSILGMAGHLVEQGAISNRQLAAYTLAFSHPDADERAYVSDATEMWRFAAYSVDIDNVHAEPLVSDIQRYQDLPDFPNLSPWQGLCAKASNNGSRVNLWGLGGDEWLTGEETHCADMLRRLQIPTLVRQFRHDLAFHRLGLDKSPSFPIRELMQWCVYPLIPLGMKLTAKRLLRWSAPSWISPEFARAVKLRDRLAQRAVPPRFPTMAQQRSHRQLDSGFDALVYELVNRMEARHNMEGRHPFNDRRLIEFALALPEDQRWRGDQTKYVLRQAMRRYLPDSIWQRRSKADYTFLDAECLVRERAGRVFQSLRLADEGYVDAGEVREMHERCCEGRIEEHGPLWMILALELWCARVFS